MSKNAQIKIAVTLGDDNVPERIHWDASESEDLGEKPCEAVFVSIWDSEKKQSLVIDLWTKKMDIVEMNYHFYQTFMKMADTYQKATAQPRISSRIRKFAEEFADLAMESLEENNNC